MATQQQANVYITNTADGNATITLSHNNSSNGTQTKSWDAAPGQTVGPLTVLFKTGFGAWSVMDYWWVSLSVRDGSTPGQYASSGSALSDWKECQLQSADAGQNLTFTVNTTTFNINLKSGSCSNSMTKTGVYSAISNVFVLMLENHSFDNIFALSGIPGIVAATAADSNSYDGQVYHVKGDAPPAMVSDPGHEFQDVVEQLAGAGAVYPAGGPYPAINNAGYVSNYATSTTENKGVLPPKDKIGDIMACFNTPEQLPVIYQLATEFAICDHWFSSLPGPTWPNRFFVHGASSAGLDHSPSTSDMLTWETVSGFTYPNGSIYDAMNKANIKWRLYVDKNGPLAGSIPQVSALKGIQVTDVHSLTGFASDLQGPYPYAYTFIEPNYGDITGGTYAGGSSQHPMDGVHGGERLIKTVYEAIRNSPHWSSSVLIIIYDEHGGFYDSVVPGEAPAPNDNSPSTLNDFGFDFKQFGVRVPAVVVSPLIPKGTVDHTVYDHASVPATLERLYNMPPLTERDQKANDIRHLFSLPTPRTDCPAQLNDPAPAAASVESVDITDITQEPLPQSGNMLGFMRNLLKADLETSSGNEAEKAAIIAKFDNIKTNADADAYANYVMAKIAGAQVNS
jgi:phospholipase C